MRPTPAWGQWGESTHCSRPHEGPGQGRLGAGEGYPTDQSLERERWAMELDRGSFRSQLFSQVKGSNGPGGAAVRSGPTERSEAQGPQPAGDGGYPGREVRAC